MLSLYVRMKILYAISVLSFCLLLWAGVAIMRHIRRVPIDPSEPEAHPDLTPDPDTARRRFKSAAPSGTKTSPGPKLS